MAVSCLRAQRKRCLVAAKRPNTQVDLEEDAEEEDFGQLPHFPLCSLSSLTKISARMNIKQTNKQTNSEDHLKGDCHHISVVYRHALKGLPAAFKQKKKHWLQEAASSNTNTHMPHTKEKRNHVLLCLTVEPKGHRRGALLVTQTFDGRCDYPQISFLLSSFWVWN